jgi:hypothetical protein
MITHIGCAEGRRARCIPWDWASGIGLERTHSHDTHDSRLIGIIDYEHGFVASCLLRRLLELFRTLVKMSVILYGE